MKLIDLLRQELPKRGGWPEGANRINQGWDGRLEKYEEDDQSYDFEMETIFPLTTNHRVESKSVHECGADFVTREQYEAASYDGTGLPPVGCPVEVNSPRHGWTQATVTAVTGSWVIAKYPDGVEYAGCHRSMNSDGSWTDNSGLFRPIRTEAEHAIDEMVRLSGVSIGAAKILYDAGYRK